MKATGIKKAIFVVAIPVLLIAIAWAGVNLLINPLLGYDRKTVAAFESIAVGQSKEAVTIESSLRLSRNGKQM